MKALLWRRGLRPPPLRTCVRVTALLCLEKGLCPLSTPPKRMSRLILGRFGCQRLRWGRGAAGGWRPVHRGDGAHVGLELERVGDLRVAREHLRHAQHLHDTALADAEAAHLTQVERGAE